MNDYYRIEKNKNGLSLCWELYKNIICDITGEWKKV